MVPETPAASVRRLGKASLAKREKSPLLKLRNEEASEASAEEVVPTEPTPEPVDLVAL